MIKANTKHQVFWLMYFLLEYTTFIFIYFENYEEFIENKNFVNIEFGTYRIFMQGFNLDHFKLEKFVLENQG